MMKYEKCLVMNTISHFSQGTKFATSLQIAMRRRKDNST